MRIGDPDASPAMTVIWLEEALHPFTTFLRYDNNVLVGRKFEPG